MTFNFNQAATETSGCLVTDVYEEQHKPSTLTHQACDANAGKGAFAICRHLGISENTQQR